MAEFGIVHRYEPSGALHGLLRVRAFTQDDAHVFCTEEQMAEECLKINDLILSTYQDFGFTGDLTVKLSTRPEKRVGSDAAWDHAENIMMDVLKQIEARSHNQKIKTAINPGEGAFYGPKFEYVLRDAIGRDWQCGTTQVDFNLPERFDAFYIAPDGSKKAPVMIHRAICGSMERFLGVVLEHYAGHLPLWLAPKQAVVATITSDGDDYAAEVTAAARKAGLRVDADLRNEKINYKVREHSLAKVPVLLVVGKKEAAERTVSIRRLGKEGQQVDAARRSLEGARRRSGAAGREAGKLKRRRAPYFRLSIYAARSAASLRLRFMSGIGGCGRSRNSAIDAARQPRLLGDLRERRRLGAAARLVGGDHVAGRAPALGQDTRPDARRPRRRHSPAERQRRRLRAPRSVVS